MDHSRRSATTGFADDFDEFDLLLEEDDAPAAPASRPGRATDASQATMLPGPTRGARLKAKAAGVGRPSIRITPDWNRIAAVLFVVAVVLLLVYFTVSSIASSRREGAYKDYFGEVREVASQSTSQGDELETILVDPNSGDRSQRIARVEQLASRAGKLRNDAAAIDAPEQLAASQEWFVTSLQYRAAGLAAVQRSLSGSIDAKDQKASADAVASAMSRLVASDVVWADSFAAGARTVLKDDGVEGVMVPDSVFVDDLEALSPKGIASMLDRLKVSTSASAATGKAKAPDDGKIRGGQLETGRVTIAPSGQTLVPGGMTEVKGGDNVTFEVPFTNQGEVQLTGVPVKITLRGKESEPMTLTGVIEVVDPGQTATAKVALDEIPNFGELLEMDVLVGPIPGEKTADNNRGSYQLQFSL